MNKLSKGEEQIHCIEAQMAGPRRFRQEKTCLGGFAITAANCLVGKTHCHLSSGT
jgi:hypothetical protein